MGSKRVAHDWSTEQQPQLYNMGFPGGSVVKHPPANAGGSGDVGLIPGLGRSLGGGTGKPLQYSCLGNVPWTEGTGGLRYMGLQESDTTE